MKFSYVVGSEEPPEPLSIELTGTDATGRPIEPRTFNCKPDRADTAVINFLGDIERASQSRKGILIATADMVTFISDSILDEEREAFKAFIEDDDVAIRSDFLTQVFFDLAGHYANRPTKRSERSSDGSSETVDTSPAASTSVRSQSFVIPESGPSAMSPIA